jgi:hypothetical protein
VPVSAEGKARLQAQVKRGCRDRAVGHHNHTWTLLLLSFLAVNAFTMAVALHADNKDESPGYVFDLAATESEVTSIVKDLASDSVLRGTYVYEKEKTLTGALPADSSSAFAPWQGPGRVFYKIRTAALSPRHFRDSDDIGTITVRYVVIPESATHTRLRIDAVFVEDSRRKAHVSDGSVETAEFGAIQAEVEKYRRDQQEAADAEKERQDEVTKGILERQRQQEAANLEAAEDSVRNLGMRLHDLQHDLELQVKAGGADLKSAPFHGAANLKSLPAGTQVLIEIITPYWYGVETPEGQHGWMRHDTVEPLP